MSYNVEGRLLRRSIPFVEEWIAELSAKAKQVKTVTSNTTTAITNVTKVVDNAVSENKADNVNNNNNNKATNAASGSANSAKKSAKKQTGATDDSATPATSMSRCCFAVGKVLEVSKHPESSKLYIEKIDLGEELNAFTNNAPRVILSGLQEYVKEEDFVNKLVLVIANLEPRKIAGIPSNGMVLCASVGEHAPQNSEAPKEDGASNDASAPSTATTTKPQTVLLNIPEGTQVGERVVFAGHDMPYAPVLKKKLAKCFEEVIAQIKTNEKGEVCWNGEPFMTSAGVITASLPNARIS